MKIVRNIKGIQNLALKIRRQGRTIGLVPTMGALHEAHASLIKRASKENDIVIVSLFVNPTQFGPNEDYLKYPRPFHKDVKICRKNGVDYLFAPSVREMYPEEHLSFVKVEGLSDTLCGQFRKVHFRGVATVVAKLFNITQPHKAYFGEKDFQQLAIIRKMTQDLNFPVEIIPCRTLREKDGLAMSSRNVYLQKSDRKNAPVVYSALKETSALIKTKKILKTKIAEQFLATRIKNIPNSRIDYAKICYNDTLKEQKGKIRLPARMLVAVWIGKTRLIDNIEIN